MCAPSPPPAPDYQGAAIAQGQANKDAAVATGQLSNPNINGPTGTRRVTWSLDPTTGNAVPTITDAYTPEQQRIFDLNQSGAEGLARIGKEATDRVGGILGEDINFERDLGTQAQGRQGVIDAMMSRYDTDLGRRRDNTEANLIARGIPRGSEAWNREMELMDRGRNDALQQATISADSRAMDERRQAITELLAQRQTPLNEISALRSGSQVNQLNFQPYTGSKVDAAPIMAATQGQAGAARDSYNAEVASSNQNTQLAGTAMMAAAMMF